MLDTERFTSLIGAIYDAAQNPALWPNVLARSAEFVDGFSAALFSKDASSKTGNIYYDDGRIEPHFKQIYFDTYIKLDPATTGHYFAELGKTVSTEDLVPYDEFLDSRFYKEWARPQGIVDFACATLDKSTTSAAMFGVFRSERHGIVNDEMRHRMRLIVPHIRRAVLISRLIDLKKAETATFADTLDGLSAGMFLVDEMARIVHANRSGHAMLAAGSVLQGPAGKLIAQNSSAQQALAEIFADAARGDAAVGVKGISVPLSTGDGEHYVAHVLPLTSGARGQTGAGYAAVAAVFVHKATLDAASPPEIISKLYKLTPSELRVLLAIVQVGGVPETAEALGIAEATVKTHLHRLFSKTGTGRQADLVKLVAGFSSPLVN